VVGVDFRARRPPSPPRHRPQPRHLPLAVLPIKAWMWQKETGIWPCEHYRTPMAWSAVKRPRRASFSGSASEKKVALGSMLTVDAPRTIKLAQRDSRPSRAYGVEGRTEKPKRITERPEILWGSVSDSFRGMLLSLNTGSTGDMAGSTLHLHRAIRPNVAAQREKKTTSKRQSLKQQQQPFLLLLDDISRRATHWLPGAWQTSVGMQQRPTHGETCCEAWSQAPEALHT
jgi:hypothetical protein